MPPPSRGVLAEGPVMEAEEAQGPCPGCVAGSHLLLGGRFGLALLDGLAAVGEVLLRFPGLLLVVRWWARAAGIRSGARSSSLMKFRRFGSSRRAAALSSRACSRTARVRLRMEDWVCRCPAPMIRPSSPLSGGAVLRAGVWGGGGQGACVCFLLCRRKWSCARAVPAVFWSAAGTAEVRRLVVWVFRS